MNALKAWDLPDQSDLPSIKHRVLVMDGHAMEVETQRGGIYRAYAYGNPEYWRQGLDSDRIVALDEFLLSKFGPARKIGSDR